MKLWTGQPLSELLPVLRAELPRAMRQLPNGAHVGLEQRDGTVRLWLWRHDRPKSDRWQARWAREVATFLRHFGCEHWQGVDLTEVGLPLPMVAAFDEPVAP